MQFKEDLLGISEATEINKQVEHDKLNQENLETGRSSKRKVNSKNAIDFTKLQYFKNPYEVDMKKL